GPPITGVNPNIESLPGVMIQIVPSAGLTDIDELESSGTQSGMLNCCTGPFRSAGVVISTLFGDNITTCWFTASKEISQGGIGIGIAIGSGFNRSGSMHIKAAALAPYTGPQGLIAR